MQHFELLKQVFNNKKQYRNECHRRIGRKRQEFAPRISDSRNSVPDYYTTALGSSGLFQKRWREMPAFAVFPKGRTWLVIR